jgi:Cdc6-like AAA superfamily ATPase
VADELTQREAILLKRLDAAKNDDAAADKIIEEYAKSEGISVGAARMFIGHLQAPPEITV